MLRTCDMVPRVVGPVKFPTMKLLCNFNFASLLLIIMSICDMRPLKGIPANSLRTAALASASHPTHTVVDHGGEGARVQTLVYKTVLKTSAE